MFTFINKAMLGAQEERVTKVPSSLTNELLPETDLSSVCVFDYGPTAICFSCYVMFA